MPIFRYILFVGGALLGLLVLADRYFPDAPREASADHVDRSVIRIHSSQNWPEAVNIDTTIPMPQATAAAPVEQSAPAVASPAPVREAHAALPAPEPKPSESKPLDKPQRHVTHLAHLSKRRTHQRIIAWQPLWQPDWTW